MYGSAVACLDDTTAALFAQRKLPDTAPVEAHLDSCEQCRRLIAALARGTDPTLPVVRDDSAMPDRVGRYRITGVLGAGGMGTVYAAHDPELDRAIAVKLVRPRGVASDEARARFVREARALAKVSHPNVVTVFDVGTHGDQIFVAMERVAGGTLRGWLATPRSWRAIVAMFVAVGRGLAAVHAHGLVHRDFKPDNVLVDGERPRVADFGLATVGPVSGDVSGTPSYMAPEQFAGQTTDARADQFSFCVALYEALYGERPFAGSTVDELAHAVTTGTIRPARGATPAWLRAAVLRGLAADPAARYPSTEALLRAIDRDPARTRRRWIGGVALAAALVGAGWVRGAMADGETCIAADEALAPVWNAERRAALAAQLGGELGLKTTALLDVHAARWRASHDAACAAHADGTQSAQAFDLRMACLADRKRELGALVAQVAKAPDGAIDAVLALPTIAPCDDVVALGRIAPVPAEHRARIDALREQLATARAAIGLAPAHDTVRAMRPIVEAAQAIGYAPLTATAQLVLGEALDRAGAHADAEAAYRAAAAAADVGGDDRTRFDALHGLVQMAALELGQAAKARELVPLAEAALARGRGDDDQRLGWELTLASLQILEGQPREAAARYATLLDTLAPDDPRRAVVAAGHATALMRFAPPPEVEAATRRAGELRARFYGNSDVERRTARIQSTEMKMVEAIPLLEQGKHAAAIALLEPAIDDLVRLAGAEHESVAAASEMLGYAYTDARRFDDAVVRHTRALAIRRTVYGEHGVEVAGSLIELSRLAHKRRDHTAAIEHATGALEIYRSALGPDASRTGAAHLTLARALQSAGRLADALPHATRAVSIGENAAWFGGALMVLGELEVGRGDVARGIVTLERAVALRDASDWDKVGAAQTRLALARARAKQGRTKLAIGLAERAAADFTTLGKPELADEAAQLVRALR